MIAVKVARGMFRRGLLVSSASGAAASQPVSPCSENTTARAKPAPDRLWLGIQLLTLSPPGPGEMNPDRASANTMAISSRPRPTRTRTDTARPRQAKKATNGANTTRVSHHR